MKKFYPALLIALLFFLLGQYFSNVHSQTTSIVGSGSPEGVVSASIGSIYYRKDGSTGATVYIKDSGSGNTGWTALTGGGGSSVPSGSILMILSGTCPSGYVEETLLNGKFPLGTLNTNGNIATTGGIDTVTPTGSIQQAVFTGNALSTHTHTFTGNALGNHAHELPFTINATTTRFNAQSTFGSGTSRAAATTVTTSSNTTSAAVALSQGVSAGTPSGSNASVSAGTPAGTINSQAFTGLPEDNRPAFVRCIYCKKQ